MQILLKWGIAFQNIWREQLLFGDIIFIMHTLSILASVRQRLIHRSYRHESFVWYMRAHQNLFSRIHSTGHAQRHHSFENELYI